MLLRNFIKQKSLFIRNCVQYIKLNSLDQELVDRRPDLDLETLVEEEHFEKIKKNITNRKGIGNIEKIHEIWKCIQDFDKSNYQSIEESKKIYKNLWDQLYLEAFQIPNKTHPSVPLGPEENGKIVATYKVTDEEFPKIKIAENLCKSIGNLSYPSVASGNRSYYFTGFISSLEKALLKYVYEYLKNLGFIPVVVPDIIHNNITVGCGVYQRTNHSIQYSLLNNPSLHLSGTSEMGLANLVEGKTFIRHDIFPKKFVSLSRCYRPEISKSAVEGKLYRVHEFFKVEMFSICRPDQSDNVLDEFVNIQKKIVEDLDIPYKLIDMASEELGASAYRKFDIVGLMPGRKIFGEITSASNCSDYQSRRLNIRYKNKDGKYEFLHTVNGTAIASTRSLICLLENIQMKKEKNKIFEKIFLDKKRGDWENIKATEASVFKYW
ncbi:SD21818p [Strongyloides ratti]|uniref:serine--tRNA ligase n=1 Tax=Strongyloides ratti TaxID=34506 RepID=A0A090L9J6_STRRB|nr:SD21818p [Strongyloides ratti]CEF64793.1 SD21818p [Strongyloides ratti]